MIDMMDDDCRKLTKEMPKGILRRKEAARPVKKLTARKGNSGCMRAFTVKPVWGWLIMKGIKDVENRWNGVQPPKGVCAVSFSKTYGRAEHEELLEYVDRKNRKLIPPFEELKKLCGKVVGIVGYEVRTSYKSKWWNGEDFAWVMSNPRWIDKPFMVKGFIGMWTMKPADAKKVLAQL